MRTTSVGCIAVTCNGMLSMCISNATQPMFDWVTHAEDDRRKGEGDVQQGTVLALHMLCYAMICHAMPCYALLCFAMP